MSGSDSEKVTTVEADAELTVTKTADKTEGVEAGETVTYTITAENTGNVTVSGLAASDPLPDVQIGQLDKAAVAPGETATATATYVVKQSDVDAGEINNTATVSGSDPKGAEVSGSDSEKVTTLVNPSLKTVKTSAGTPTGTDAEGNPAYALGDVITYTVKVTNDGNLTLTDIEVEDGLVDWVGDDTKKIDQLVPGESQEFTATYTVTSDDILAGKVVNIATATGSGPGGHDPDPTPGTKEDPTEEPNPSMKLNKTSTGTMTGTGADGNPAYAVGDKMTYMIEVTNDGNLTISDIVVVDEKLGYTEAAPYEYRDEIAPGTTVTVLTRDYTVAEADVDAGSVLNEATATGTTPGGGTEPVSDTDEQPVQPRPQMYTITYVLNGGSYAGSTENIVETYPAGTVISIHAAPMRDGYVFDYWDGPNFQPGDKYTVTGDYVFTAQWRQETPTPTPTPTPGPAPGPGPAPAPVPDAAAAGGAAPAAPAAQNRAVGPEVVPDDDTPLVEEIDDEGNPLSGNVGSWSLFDLICTILTALLAIIMLIGVFGRKRQDDEEDEEQQQQQSAYVAYYQGEGEQEDEQGETVKRRRALRIASIIPAIVAIVLFILTQDLTQPMVIFDWWSIAFAIITIVNIILIIASHKKKTDDDDDEQQQQVATATA